MKYYAYCRTSTESQKRKNGCSWQIHEIEEYCKENNIVIQEWFIDEGITGTTAHRPRLIDLLADLEEGDIIVVPEISRLWRSEETRVLIQTAIIKRKANIISILEPKYSIYDTDNIINKFYDLFNIYDRFQVIKTLQKGRRDTAATGKKPCGTAPYGYKWKNEQIVVDDEKAQIVKEIFSQYIELGSLSKLKSYCDSRGYRSSRGREFTRTALKNIINNDFYIGVITYDGKKTKGAHPVFLDESLYEQANAILKR